MKTLLLMRHAKSNMAEKASQDRERSLSKRGRKNAAQMGELLKDEKMMPDFILSSNASRASQTADQLIEAMKYKGDRCFLNNLYMAEVDVYASEIQRISDDVNTLLLIGHNPVLDSLLQMVTDKVEDLSTAAIAHIRLPIDSWTDFSLQTQGELVNLWRPKDL
jgi:phosphohistidine phosphatase